MNVAISGANRGIGLEFCRQLSARGDAIFAGAREPARAAELKKLSVKILPLDVARDESVEEFANALGGEPIHLLINNAGVMGPRRDDLTQYDFAEALETLNINALGPLRLFRALLPNLRKAKGAKVIGITSGLGSIEDNTSGGYYAYRMSKAALNMGTRSIANDFAKDGITSVVIQPGWVQTDMGGHGAPTRVEDSVRGMLKTVDALTPKDNGQFLSWEGGKFPW